MWKRTQYYRLTQQTRAHVPLLHVIILDDQGHDLISLWRDDVAADQPISQLCAEVAQAVNLPDTRRLHYKSSQHVIMPADMRLSDAQRQRHCASEYCLEHDLWPLLSLPCKLVGRWIRLRQERQPNKLMRYIWAGIEAQMRLTIDAAIKSTSQH
jgi:hypothetical protein